MTVRIRGTKAAAGKVLGLLCWDEQARGDVLFDALR